MEIERLVRGPDCRGQA